jgi:hypothetical protein
VLNWDFKAESLNALSLFASKPTPNTFKTVEIPRDRIFTQLAIWHQGKIGSCQGHGIAKLVMALYFFATGEVLEPSRLHAYIASQAEDGLVGSDCGSTITGGIERAKKGLVTAAACPYRDTYPTASEIRRILALVPDKRLVIKSGIKVESWQHARELTAGLMPITIGTYWPFVIDQDWVCRKWQRISGGGGHARCLPGHFKNSNPGEDNSWGTNWGDQGRFWWAEPGFNNMLRDPQSVAIAVSELAEPQARWADLRKLLWET